MDETIYLQEPGVSITTKEIILGRFAYSPGEIQGVHIETRKPNTLLRSLAFFAVFLAAAYISFQNILGILLMAIILAPSLAYVLRPKPYYVLSIHTAEDQNQPAASRNKQDLERIQNAIDQLLYHSPSEISREIANPIQQDTELEFKPYLPKNCPKCDRPLTLENAIWPSPENAQCPTCSYDLEITWRKN